MKFALISHVLPPSETSQAAIIQRLLRNINPSKYCLLSSRDYTSGEQPNYSGGLSGKHYHVRPWFQLPAGSDIRLRAAVEVTTFWLAVGLRARAIARILKQENCDAIVVCTGGDEIRDFPAAYLASRLVGARFYTYVLDQYMFLASYGFRKTFLRRLEGPIMKGLSAVIEAPIIKGSSAVIVHNEFQREELLRSYRVDAVVIHNPCDLDDYERNRGSRAGTSEAGRSRSEVKIVYTGSVGDLHYQAFRNLVGALNLLDRKDVRLHLYTTSILAANCKREGIHGAVVYHPYEVASAMPVRQQQADVLFLPLAFGTIHPEIIRMAAPGKMGEYLAARRPILVHAPPDSFIAWYFRRYECGIVVDENDQLQLANALQSLLTDASLRERLSERAWERALEDFNLSKAQDEFASVLRLA